MRGQIAVLSLVLLLSVSAAGQVLAPHSAAALRYGAQHTEDSVQHLAVLPYIVRMNDTLAVLPLVEAPLFVSSATLQGLAAGGLRVLYGNSGFNLDARLLAGAALPDKSWQYPTMPFVGKAADAGNVKLFFDPRFTLTYHTKYLRFEAGRDKFHLGHGYRSVWLDSYGPAVPYVGATAKVWRVLYGFRISYLQNPDDRFPGREFFHAYNITHYFDFSFGRLNINMFETVVQDPVDSLGARRGFDFFNYANPVIFFRAVDLSLGSPDNVLLGLGGSLRLWKSTYLYGYGVLDELIVSHLLAGDNCWCLKYGANAGVKTFHFAGLEKLFVQAEASFVRPYTFSHDNPVLAYGNLYQPLAHPLGANFYEGVFRAVYYDTGQTLEFKTVVSYFGQDIDTLNYGKDIFRSYTTRVAEYGVTIGQGNPMRFVYASAVYSHKVRSGLWIKAGAGFRYLRAEQDRFEPFVFIGLSSDIVHFDIDWQ